MQCKTSVPDDTALLHVLVAFSFSSEKMLCSVEIQCDTSVPDDPGKKKQKMGLHRRELTNKTKEIHSFCSLAVLREIPSDASECIRDMDPSMTCLNILFSVVRAFLDFFYFSGLLGGWSSSAEPVISSRFG